MPTLAPPARALVREVSATYADCIRTSRGAAIDVGAARRQHAGYVDALRELGVPVDVVPADDACPDACFVEDTAVITGRHALATCPGAPARRAEVPAVAAALATLVEVHAMSAPATLDGGDVLRAGDRLFVGLSSRTNRAGLEALARVADKDGLSVVALEVRGGLHLKSACTLASGSLVVFDPDVLGQEELRALEGAGLRAIAAPESAGANVLALGDAVIVSDAAPKTAAKLAAEGLRVRRVSLSEIHKGDGALTCLSLRLPRGGFFAV
jgi:dimethylargininase